MQARPILRLRWVQTMRCSTLCVVESSALYPADPVCRGFLAALLSEPAKDVELRHARAVQLLERFFSAVLGLGLIRRRLQEVSKYSVHSFIYCRPWLALMWRTAVACCSCITDNTRTLHVWGAWAVGHCARSCTCTPSTPRATCSYHQGTQWISDHEQ